MRGGGSCGGDHTGTDTTTGTGGGTGAGTGTGTTTITGSGFTGTRGGSPEPFSGF